MKLYQHVSVNACHSGIDVFVLQLDGSANVLSLTWDELASTASRTGEPLNAAGAGELITSTMKEKENGL